MCDGPCLLLKLAQSVAGIDGMADRRIAKFWVDVGLLISGFLCIVTGIIKLPGVLGLFDVRHVILPVYQITLVHDFSGLIFSVLILIHVGLNWRWMVGVSRSLQRHKK